MNNTSSPVRAEILLINPPSGIFYGLGPNFAPIGLFSLAAVLRAEGFSVAVLNANYFPDYQNRPAERRPDEYYYADDLGNPAWTMLLDFIAQTGPKLVGFSAHDLAVGGIKLLAGAIKKRWPEMIVAVGGPTPTGAPDIFDDCREIDYLLAGEGEATLIDLARRLKARSWRPLAEPERVAGIYHFDGVRFVFTASRPPLADLDALPDPPRDYYWLDYAGGRVLREVQLNGVYTSRGCLKSCRFCGARTLWPGPVRYRSIDRVVAEIIDLRRRHGLDFQHFSIFDDDFLARPERVFEFCRLLAETGDDFRFRCYGRVNNLLNEELVETLFRSGCQEIWVGVESGSQKVLKALGKGITVGQIRKLDRLFHKYDFPWLAFIILGTPPESEADILMSLEMLKEGRFPSIQPFVFHPYTGTDLFRELQAAGRLGYDDVIRGHQNLPSCFSRQVEPERFFALLEELKQLAELRRAQWFDDFYPGPEQEAAAAWEEETAAWLAENRRSFLVLGPERQLRWLAALNHYRGLGANLKFIDADAAEESRAAYGLISPLASLAGEAPEEILIIAPAAQARNWLDRAGALFPAARLNILSGPGRGRFREAELWRPVYELCRGRHLSL